MVVVLGFTVLLMLAGVVMTVIASGWQLRLLKDAGLLGLETQHKFSVDQWRTSQANRTALQSMPVWRRMRLLSLVGLAFLMLGASLLLLRFIH